MRTINLKLQRDMDFSSAEDAAKKALNQAGEVTLVAWTDRKRDMEGPGETCSGEGWKCSRVYAENHQADVRVSVNDDDYEFYFAGVPADYTQLDAEAALEIHGGASSPDFDYLQGG